MVSEYMLELMKKRDRAVHEWDDRRLCARYTVQFWVGIAFIGFVAATVVIEICTFLYLGIKASQLIPTPSDLVKSYPLSTDIYWILLLLFGMYLFYTSITDFVFYKDLVDFYDKTDEENPNG